MRKLGVKGSTMPIVKTIKKPIWWAKKNPNGSFTVDTSKLVFSIVLHELAMAECLHTCDAKGERIPLKTLKEIWKAEVLNVRQIPKMKVAQASYHCFYKPMNNEYSWREGWKTSWEHTNYLFSVDLNSTLREV